MVRHATGSQSVIAYMEEEGVNVSENTRKQLTPQMVENSDRVVVITSKDSWPEYLVKSEKVTFWDIPNAVGMTPEAARVVYDQVKQRVKDLVDEIG